jgi:hypothetical protein
VIVVLHAKMTVIRRAACHSILRANPEKTVLPKEAPIIEHSQSLQKDRVRCRDETMHPAFIQPSTQEIRLPPEASCILLYKVSAGKFRAVL